MPNPRSDCGVGKELLNLLVARGELSPALNADAPQVVVIQLSIRHTVARSHLPPPQFVAIRGGQKIVLRYTPYGRRNFLALGFGLFVFDDRKLPIFDSGTLFHHGTLQSFLTLGFESAFTFVAGFPIASLITAGCPLRYTFSR